MVKQLFLLSFLTVLSLAVFSQDSSRAKANRKQDMKAEKRERINALIKLEEEGDPAYKKQGIFGFKAASDGYGIFYEKGKYKTPKRTSILQFELNEKKHPKEYKTANTYNLFTGQLNSFVYGKLNNFFQFKVGMGEQYLLGGKANKNGVSVSAVYAGGVSLGLLKPYYVDFQNGDTTGKITFDSIIAHPSQYPIVGASGIFYGWSKLKIKPGLHAKAAMRFDYGRLNESVTALEAGLNVEYYFDKIPQMVNNKEKNFFFNAYIAIEFGRRK